MSIIPIILKKRQGSLSKPWYGVTIDESLSSPNLVRGGSDMTLHASLPVHSAMKSCVLGTDGNVAYYLDPTDWSKKADGTASNRDGTDGHVMIEVPTYYRNIAPELSGVYGPAVSLRPFAGSEKVNKFYIGAYEGVVNRTGTIKLWSIKNTDAEYRGGNNNAAYDGAANSFLGKPATAISETNFRTYARNWGSTKWNQKPYRIHMLLTELFLIEYATLNSQKAVNATLTAEGYKQGGLGNGVTTANSTEWNAFNAYYPFINTGASDSLADGSGEVSVTVTDFGGVGTDRTFTVPRYRGIENLFGHIWEWADGASVFFEGAGGVGKFYICDDPANFADGTETNYSYRANVPTANGYVSKMHFDAKGVLIPESSAGGALNTFFCDYYYQPGLVNAWRAALVGGHAYDGTLAGLALVLLLRAASLPSSYFGSRLCYIP